MRIERPRVMLEARVDYFNMPAGAGEHHPFTPACAEAATDRFLDKHGQGMESWAPGRAASNTVKCLPSSQFLRQ